MNEICIKCKQSLPPEAFSPSVLKYRIVIRCRACVAANKARRAKQKKSNCVRCGTKIPAGNFRRLYCTNICARRAVVLRGYGLPPDADLHLLKQQDGACAACGESLVEANSKNVHIDHDHETGRVRGILCHLCNVALGHTQDDIERQFKLGVYLARHQLDLRGLCVTR